MARHQQSAPGLSAGGALLMSGRAIRAPSSYLSVSEQPLYRPNEVLELLVEDLFESVEYATHGPDLGSGQLTAGTILDRDGVTADDNRREELPTDRHLEGSTLGGEVALVQAF